jgi:small subunit ribosomal protein S18
MAFGGKDKDYDGKGKRDMAPAPSGPKTKAAKTSASGKIYVDYKENETLRRLCGSNGKIGGRKRNSSNALEQRLIASAVKRARFMALMPYVNIMG